MQTTATNHVIVSFLFMKNETDVLREAVTDKCVDWEKEVERRRKANEDHSTLYKNFLRLEKFRNVFRLNNSHTFCDIGIAQNDCSLIADALSDLTFRWREEVKRRNSIGSTMGDLDRNLRIAIELKRNFEFRAANGNKRQV